MTFWREVWAFVRGTRVRPPPGPSRPVPAVLLVVASLLHLPLVYLIVRSSALPPAVTLFVGVLAMALAWSAGTSLEGRRRGTSMTFAGLGGAEAVLLVMPGGLGPELGAARLLVVVSAVLCVAAWALLRKS